MTLTEEQNTAWETYAVNRIKIAEAETSRHNAIRYSEEEFFKKVESLGTPQSR